MLISARASTLTKENVIGKTGTKISSLQVKNLEEVTGVFRLSKEALELLDSEDVSSA